MNAVPPSFAAAPRAAFAPTDAIGVRWDALTEVAQVVAALAGAAPEPVTARMRDFPLWVERAECWRRERIAQAIADLAAVMAPGISALLNVNRRGADPRPAAMTLWHEFATARAAILSLLPPEGEAGVAA